MNRRPFIDVFVEALTWILFGGATFLLARQTWYAVQGLQPDYGTIGSAYIVAGLVTATWLVMLGRIVRQIDGTPVDFALSVLLMIAGILIDIVVALSIVFNFRFPAHLALLVVVAHVAAHVIQWTVSAVQKAASRFSGSFVDPVQAMETKIAKLEKDLALAEQAQDFAQQAQATAQQPHATAQRALIERDCPNCARTFKGNTVQSAQNAVNAHLRTCKKTTVSSNGHKQPEAEKV